MSIVSRFLTPRLQWTRSNSKSIFADPTNLEPEKILNSNRVVRMIADHEKIEDELANGINDWIFLGLVIDRVLLLIFILSFAFGSCMLFYGLQEAEFTVDRMG